MGKSKVITLELLPPTTTTINFVCVPMVVIQEKFCGWKYLQPIKIQRLLEGTTCKLSRNMVRCLYCMHYWALLRITGCPKILRADRGTENAKVAFLHPFLRHQCTDGEDNAEKDTFRYGRSVNNQV